MKDLKPAYLLIGTDKLKVKTVLERLNKRLSEYGDMSMNTAIYDANTANINEIINSANTIPFMAEARYIQINNAEKLNKDNTEILVKYLSVPAKTTIMALVCDKLNKSSKLYKAIDPSCIISCATEKKYLLAESVQKIARSHGGNIDINAAKKLVELVGENTLMLDSQIKKLLLTCSNITIDDIDKNVSRTATSKPWDFTNAIAAKNPKLAIKIFRSMDEGSEYALLSMTCDKIKELIGTKIVGENELGKAPWQVKNYRLWANNFSMTELTNILDKALECEVKMKSTSDSALAFECFIMDALK